MRAVLPALFALVACGGSKPPAADPAPPATSSLLTCAKVANHVATTVEANRPRPYATHAAINEMVTSRCTTDAWTDETKRCLFAMKTIAEGRACATSMSDEQRNAIRAHARSLRNAATGSDTEPDDPSADWVRHVVEE